jgi:chloride channel protein, CIC family
MNTIQLRRLISWDTWKYWVDTKNLRQHEDKVLLMLTLLIGATVGLVIVAFIVLTENLGSRMYPGGGAAWRRIVVPVLGALITGYLLKRYFPNARGSGIPQTKTALFLHEGVIRLRTVLGKFGCSSVSLASGIALGREGPSVQVGAGIASVLGRQLGLSPETIKALVPIGSAAALAAAFNTPIAAVLFTLEEVMGDLHARVLGAIVLSSATSWMVLHLLLGDEPLFHVPAYQLVNPLEFGIYAVLGVIGGLVSVCFVKLLLGLRKYFKRMPSGTEWLQPTVGGLLVGILGWYVPSVLGVGYNHVNQALNGQMALSVMALLVVLKLVATATCYASGNAGGIFGPSLFIGAMLGGALGGGAHILLPDYTGSVGAYALVGMGTAFAGIIRVPMTSVIMIFEITRDYSIIVPLMIANMISYFISTRLQEEPIYEALMHQDGIHLPIAARHRDEVLPVKLGMHPPEVVLNSTDRIEHVLATEPVKRIAWPVVDEGGLLGIVTRTQLEDALNHGQGNGELSNLLSPIDPEVEPAADQFPHVHLDQPLESAMRRMAQANLNLLPVVGRTNLRELVGIISWNDALAAFKLDRTKMPPEPPKDKTKAPIAWLGGVLAVLLVMVALAGFLTYSYRSQRNARAEMSYKEGNALMADARYPEAIERFRSALSISHSNRDRLSLALALSKAARTNEAEIYLKELIRSDPNNGPANLGLAQIAEQQGNVQDAVDMYHKAIHGFWAENARNNRIQARMELVAALGKFGRKTQAQAELLLLVAEMPKDVSLQKQIGRLLLDYGLVKESADVFQGITQRTPQDGEGYAGLGWAEFALGDFRSAQQSFRSAIRGNPDDVTSRKQLELVEQILSIDPNLRGLNTSEKYARSRKLLEAALGSLDQCLAAETNQLLPSTTEIADAARKSLLYRGRPRSLGDAVEANVALSEQLWKVRIDSCGPPKDSEEMLRILMSRLSK